MSDQMCVCRAFLFPKDMELEMDYWAETGAFDTDELHELHIQDNKLFTGMLFNVKSYSAPNELYT